MFKEDISLYKKMTKEQVMEYILESNLQRRKKDIKTLWLNRHNVSFSHLIHYIEFCGDEWYVRETDYLVTFYNYQPCLTEETLIEFWR